MQQTARAYLQEHETLLAWSSPSKAGKLLPSSALEAEMLHFSALGIPYLLWVGAGIPGAI